MNPTTAVSTATTNTVITTDIIHKLYCVKTVHGEIPLSYKLSLVTCRDRFGNAHIPTHRIDSPYRGEIAAAAVTANIIVISATATAIDVTATVTVTAVIDFANITDAGNCM